MKKALLTLLTIFLICITPSFAAEKTRLTVMTYNIRHGKGIDEVVDIDRILEVIARANPDIVVLNEVDQGRIRSGGVLQVQYLADRLGMEHVFGIAEGKTNYGNAILSKFPIVDSEVFDLVQPRWMKAVTRVCVRISVDIDGNTLDVYGTHLGLGGFQEIQTEMGHIYNKYKERENPSIIAGDLNIVYVELKSAVKELFDDFKSANHYLGIDLYTFPSDYLSRQIDFILLNTKIEPLSIFTVESLASDHLPVVCEMEVDFE